MAAESFDDASKIANSATIAFPNDSYLRDLQGTLCLLRLDCEGARKSFEEASKLEPSNPLLNFHLAQTYSPTYVGEKRLPHCVPKSSDPKRVIALCSQAASNQNFVMAYPSVLLLLAEGYLREGKAKEAIPVLENAVQYPLRASIAWKLLGQANQSAGFSDKAKLCRERERIFAQFEIDQMKKEASTLLQEGKEREVTGLLQTILETNPDDQESLSTLSKLAEKSPLAKQVLEQLSLPKKNQVLD